MTNWLGDKLDEILENEDSFQFFDINEDQMDDIDNDMVDEEKKLRSNPATEEIIKRIEKRALLRGGRSTIRAIHKHFMAISFLIYSLCVPSQKAYKLLRNIMMYNCTGEVGFRRSAIKVNGRAMPTFASLNQIKIDIEENKYDLEFGQSLFFWNNEINLEYGTYMGTIIPLEKSVSKFFCMQPSNQIILQPIQLELLIWTDGAHVERSCVYSRFRILDKSKKAFEKGHSDMKWWFAINGGESDVRLLTRIRIEQVENLEKKIWTKNGFYFQIKLKYISGDHKMLWTEMGQWLPYRCTICFTLPDSSNWLSFQPNQIQRTLQFQNFCFVDHQGGVAHKPLFGFSKTIALQNVKCVVPLLHDVKGVLQHGLAVIKQFVRLQNEDGNEIPKTLQRAQDLVTGRIRNQGFGTLISWGRQFRTIFAHWRTLFNGVLGHPSLKVFVESGAIFTNLCYTTTEPQFPILHYARLQLYSWLFIQLLNYFWISSGKPKKVPKCDSIYEHSLIAHLATQYRETNILPIWLSEEDGEASIHQAKAVRSNHWESLSIKKQVVAEQLKEIGEKWLCISDQKDAKKSYMIVNRLPHVPTKHLRVWECAWKLNGSNSFHSVLTELQGIGELKGIINYDSRVCLVFSIGEVDDYLDICVCGQHATSAEVATDWIAQFVQMDWSEPLEDLII